MTTFIALQLAMQLACLFLAVVCANEAHSNTQEAAWFRAMAVRCYQDDAVGRVALFRRYGMAAGFERDAWLFMCQVILLGLSGLVVGFL